jgi:Tfp pilus assembly PilM family ATPase
MMHSFGKWWRQPPGWLGLSIDSQGMTLVALCHEAMASGHIQRSVAQDWLEAAAASPWQDPSAIGVAIHAWLKHAGLPRWRLAMGLPQDQVAQGSLQVQSSLPERDIRAQVIWAAGQALQLEWDAVVVDYRCEKQAAETRSGSGTRKVSWGACGKAWALAADQMSRSAGLSLQFLGVEPVRDISVIEDKSLRYRVACDLAWQGARS